MPRARRAGSLPSLAAPVIPPLVPSLSMQGDRAILSLGSAEARLTARECVKLSSQLLACADVLFREEDSRAPVEVPVTTGEFTTERYEQMAEGRAARRRARRTGTEIDPNTGLPREE